MKVLLYLGAIVLSIPLVAQDAVPENVMILEQREGFYPPCEPSIAIDPTNPARMVVGAVLKYVCTSEDSGRTWHSELLESRYGVYGDPCLVANEKGQFNYFHLSNPTGNGWADEAILDRMVCQRQKKWGKGFDKGWGIGLNPPKDQDKEWGIWDPINKQWVLTWTQFDTYGSKDEACESNILLSTSKNGKRWRKAVDVSTLPGNCIDNSGTVEGAVPAVYVDGSLCTAWGLDGNIHFKRLRLDGKQVETIVDTLAVTGSADWDFEIPGLGRANGMPILLCDLSGGDHHGTLYINWADQRNGPEDTDIWMVRSTDGGITWSAPIRINDDATGSHQFFTWMAIDQRSGKLYTAFYDRRNYTDERTDVYLAVSQDGGLTWTNRKISATPFTPSKAVFFGDYNNISAVNGVVRPIWTRYEDGKLSVWTALINEKGPL